ncbi:small-subunit processome [Hypoxylon trugodes]|uniref:small-subunit processome n=1 Tax=Hypoxylon trugodes TaxID=326681 RepID=UPI00219D309A|nr:small-subunit processome [Hypoxylon trugodes]KAI1387262.1 small-subunit processome [Hypoxylon trugodes]
MPGRQAHGRPLGGGASSSGKSKKRSKSRSTKKAMNAFAIASEEYADNQKRTPRNRELDVPRATGGSKHARDEDDDEEDEYEDEGPPRKMRRGGDDEDVEYGSDSSGNEWRVGVDEDDDSEIDSDEAFGESDEERFEDYAFRGSRKKPKQKKKDDSDEDDDDEDIDDADGASLGSDAIDLAQALDMSMSEDDGPEGDQEESGSDEESGDDDVSGDESSDVEDEEDDDVSDSGINAWVSKFSGVKDADEEDAAPTTTKPKLGLKDLGLLGIKDPQLKKSLKLMKKEEKSSKPQKLDVPLARRQQAKLDRTAAYEKTNEVLDRWTETVKHNRRADHLVFPLPQTETGLARHDNSEIQPLNHKTAGTELEQTILAIMEESGLGPSAKKETKETEDLDDDDAQGLSGNNLKDLWQQKRRERELKSREDARAKRIKKIKSKAYHRVHRKQRERDEIKEREIMAATGEIDSEEEREAQDRQRAMERMGARHRESKWAKMTNKNGRAAWDDDVRVGVADMARRDEELRRRIEGKPAKANGDSDDDSDYSGGSDDVDERKRLLQQLNDVSDAEDGQPKSKLMSMQFMRKAEAAKKKANDELVAEIRRDLASDDDGDDESDDGPEDIGRRKFGQPSGDKKARASEQLVKASKKDKAEKAGLQIPVDEVTTKAAGRSKGLSASVPQDVDANSIAGAWSQPAAAGPSKKQRGKKTSSNVEVLELGADSVAVAASAAPVKKFKPSKKQVVIDGDDSSDDGESHLPIQFREQDLIEKAFGGLDVVAEFEQDKAAIEEDDDDKIIDNTLPGWGSWVGDGVSNREKKRHQGRFLTKQEGITKKDRKDAGLQSVIINEKRNKKNDRFLASQLPHPYESRLQYERALRLPVGPEWMTKETFQEATKPKILMKQGIIAPIAKPTH